MHDKIHVMLATGFSMIITFGLDYLMNKVASKISIFQTIYFDLFRGSFIIIRCFIIDRKSLIVFFLKNIFS